MGRPQWLREKLRRQELLWRLADLARLYTVSVSRRRDEEAAITWAALRTTAYRCTAAGCSRDQVGAALDAGGVVDEREQEARRQYLADVASGLPEDLRAAIEGNRRESLCLSRD